MKPVLTAEEYRRVDKAYTGDIDQAMDRAGYAVALAAVRNGARYGKTVIVLAGPGNNGGDGYVAARYLKDWGADVEVRALAAPKTDQATRAADQARAVGIRNGKLGEPQAADLVIDALFGGGVRDGLPESVVKWMAGSAPVIAVDYPTGLDPDTGIVDDVAFNAVETVTFSTLKTGHVRQDGPDYCGQVTVADIGIDGGRPCMYLAEETDAKRPSRERKAHKWSAGAVLVVGGSLGMLGAAVFAGKSALRFGAGSVVVVTPRPEDVQQLAPELPSFTAEAALERLGRFDVVVAGPGLAESDFDEMSKLIRQAPKVVLDAGGLQPGLLDEAKAEEAEVVITPHAAEIKRLGAPGDGDYSIRSFARKHGVTLLMKGNPTRVTDGDHPVLIDSGGPELASIGTGDVLAGMVGALWARGLDARSSAISAAYWHGVAARDLAGDRTVTADVLAEYISSYAW